MIVATQLTRRFGRTDALRGATFEVPDGKICGFIGPNGAGKTTAMRILATLDLPGSGSVKVAGMDAVLQARDVRRIVGFMPDYYGTYPDLSVEDYVDFFARAQGLKSEPRQRRVREVVEFTELGRLLPQLVEGLSKGQKQRLSLARTLLSDPKLLILDEPAAGLDPRARIELRELLKALAEQGKTIFISSHILGELTELIDWLVIIDGGRVRHSGPPGTIAGKTDAATYVVELLSDEAEARRFALEQPGVLAVDGGEGLLLLQIDEKRQPPEELLAKMVRAELRFRQFYRKDLNLEDVFLSVTQRASEPPSRERGES